MAHQRIWRKGIRVIHLVVIIALLFLHSTQSVQAASTYTVTNTKDSGPGSLRDAILYANNNSSDPPGTLITFNIPKSDPGYGLNTPGVWTIRLMSALPFLSGGVTTIDGSSQSSNQGNTNPDGPEVEIDGVNLGPNDAVFTITSGYNTITGLTINYGSSGVLIVGSPMFSPVGNTVQDCYIGTDATRKIARPNDNGIDIHGGAKSSYIFRNHISGNTLDGISVSGSGTDNNQIVQNDIGYWPPGDLPPIPNGRHGIFINGGPSQTLIENNSVIASGMNGIYILSSSRTTLNNNIVGGDQGAHPGKSGISIEGGSSATVIQLASVYYSGEHGIWISGNGTTASVFDSDVEKNTLHGIAIYDNAGPVSLNHNFVEKNGWTGVAIVNSSNNTLTDNQIGLDDYFPNWQLGNGYYGVAVVNGSNNTIGPGNQIAFNGSDGVRIDGASAVNNRITQNAIYQNGGKGIHLVNDANAQVMTPQVYQADCAMVRGMAGSNFTVEIFSDMEDEGQYFAGSTTAIWLQPAYFWSGSFRGPKVTVTATDGSGNTSEFSPPFAGACLRSYLPITQK